MDDNTPIKTMKFVDGETLGGGSGSMTIAENDSLDATPILTDKELEDLKAVGIIPQKVRSGRYASIMSSSEEMLEAAYDAAEIIDKTGRVPLSFTSLISDIDPDFTPDCDYNNGAELCLDPNNSSSKQSGRLTEEQLREVVNTKLHCMECPFKTECLAVSFTGLQITRTSRSERILPGTENTHPLVLDEYLIFGGYTPKERRVIFEHVCDILEEKDAYDNNK